MDLVQLIGYAAGLIIAVSLAPQVIKAWKTRSTKDISILWNMIYICLSFSSYTDSGFISGPSFS